MLLYLKNVEKSTFYTIFASFIFSILRKFTLYIKNYFFAAKRGSSILPDKKASLKFPLHSAYFQYRLRLFSFQYISASFSVSFLYKYPEAAASSHINRSLYYFIFYTVPFQNFRRHCRPVIINKQEAAFFFLQENTSLLIIKAF